MKAVIVTGGKQYYVEKGTILYIEKLDAEASKTITFNEVLMVDDVVGTPTVKGASVKAKVLKHGKEKKVVIYKYNAKKKYRKKQGHRQPYTKVEIESISVK